MSMYYKELYKDEKPAKDAPKVSKFRPRTKPPKSGRRCASTTPEPSVREQHRPTRRSSSAMLRAVSEDTSTSEVCCRLNQKYLSIIHHNLYTAITKYVRCPAVWRLLQAAASPERQSWLRTRRSLKGALAVRWTLDAAIKSLTLQ